MDLIPWNSEELSTLYRGIAANLSARSIARTIGRTRNAIIGKVHRLGLTLGGAPGIVDMEARRKRKAAAQARYEARRRVNRPMAPKVAMLRPVALAAPAGCPVGLLDLTSQTCRWPVDAPTGPMLYCGGRTAIDAVYCPYHCMMAYRRRGDDY